MKKISEKDIADDVNVSTSSVNRIMDYISSNTVLRHEHLPSSMNFDEFKATKDTSGKMAFIIVNNISGNVFDILDSIKSNDLFKYFLRYRKKDRDNVKFISTDFYSGYISLKVLFFLF